MELIEDRLRPIKDELVVLKKELDAMPKGVKPSDAEWVTWQQKAHRMHLLSMRLLACKLQALEDLLSRAKIFLFTVDAFIQIACGEFILSKMFKGIACKLVVIDEAHELDLHQAAAVAAVSQFLVLLYDKAQNIVFRKQSNRNGKETSLALGDCYSWERAVYGGTSTPSMGMHAGFTCPQFGVQLALWSYQLSIHAIQYEGLWKQFSRDLVTIGKAAFIHY